MSKIFPAKIEELYAMLDFISSFVEDGEVGRFDLEKIQMASEEALVNIISYAYPEGEGEVEVDCAFSDLKELKIVIKDKGVCFNPLEDSVEVDIEASIDERNIGGLGLMMIRKFMDQVSYERNQNMNILTMKKRISPEII